MSRRAECWDNAVAESFFGRFKEELLYRERWPTKKALYEATQEYISCFYNLVRRHSALGYVSPMEYERIGQRGSLAA